MNGTRNSEAAHVNVARLIAYSISLAGIALTCGEAAAATIDWFSTLPAAKQADVLWKETHESAPLGKNGTVGSWDGTGKPWSSGTTSYEVVASPAHSGIRAVASTIDTSQTQSGVRWAIRDVPGPDKLPDAAYYSAWVYFPEVFDSEWYMLMQWKTESSLDGSDPVKSVNIERENDGKLHLALYDFVGTDGTYNGAGAGMRAISPLVFPSREWVHLEAFYKWDTGPNGSITVWQNGVEVLSQANTRTQYPYNYGTLPRQWSVNAYGDKLNPNPHTMLLDDAAISTTRLGAATGNSSLPGDFNLNGRVDAADYTVWRAGLGSTYTAADYTIWKTHFGQTAGSAALAAPGIPEPSSVLLAATALIATISCLRVARP
ncbi:MAG: heparin lyase I family protein [Pirellulales bacterium]